jgi:hypothetical protein
MSKSSLAQWLQGYTLDALKARCRRIDYDREYLDAFLNARKRGSTSEPLPAAVSVLSPPRSGMTARRAAHAAAIVKVLGGRKAGANWMARCPAHDDRVQRLSIDDADDGKVLVRCHAGCDQRDASAALIMERLWPPFRARRCTILRSVAKRRPDQQEAERKAAALALSGNSRGSLDDGDGQ